MAKVGYSLIEETLGYVTAEDATNTDPRYLVSGSRDVLIDRERKVKSRAGYTRLGAANTAMTPIRSAYTWYDSKGNERALRQYSTLLEVYLDSIDGTSVAAWTQVVGSLSSTEKIRYTTWWDATEDIDLLLFVIGDANIYEWNGAVAVVDSVPSGTTVKKTGTTTFAENRFYTTRNKTLVCVRTGTEYPYTGGESTTTLTGIADTTGLQAGDILIQKVVTNSNQPASGRNNDTIFTHQNQVHVGSNDDAQVYVSKDTSFTDYTFSSPRVPGEGALLSLDNPVTGFGLAGSALVIFAGRHNAYTTKYNQITVGSTLSETLEVTPLDTGIDQAAQSQELMEPIGNALAYISYEPALRIINNPTDIAGVNPKTYSNPIKPDFDAEDWTNATMKWFKNALYMNSSVNSKLYILELVEDADGKKRQFWQPPQYLPVGPLEIIADALHAHSNAVAETYALFNGTSDGMYSGMAVADKLPINAIARFAYQSFGNRRDLKNADLYYSEGQILHGTSVELTLRYDFGGSTQTVTKSISGDNNDIVYQDQSLSSLGQSPLGQQPLGGSSVEPSNTLKYTVEFELPKEDFHEIQEEYATDEPDTYFSVLARGFNAQVSRRRDIKIRL